jgi:hypothetical protein
MPKTFAERCREHGARIDARWERFDELERKSTEADKDIEGVVCELGGGEWKSGYEMVSAHVCRTCAGAFCTPDAACFKAAEAMLDRFDAEAF